MSGQEPANAEVGTLAYATDTDRIRVKTSTGWVDVAGDTGGSTGDIDGVIAGTGLLGGGTVGTVTLQIDFGTGATQVRPGNDPAYTDARTPLAHAASHQDGGSDEISIQGLSGVAADAQKLEVARAGVLTSTRKQINFVPGANVTLTVADNPGSNRADVTIASAIASHAASHQDGGADEINVTALSGLAADAQKLEVAKAGILTSIRKQINFIDGANVTTTVTDNVGGNRTDVTISAVGSGGGGGGTVSAIAEGVGINVTSPTGPTVTVAADIGTGPGQVAAGDNVLLRSDNDWDSFPFEEGTPSAGDKFLFERASDGAKKVVTAGTLNIGNTLLREDDDWSSFPTQASLDPDDCFLIERASDGAKQLVFASSLEVGNILLRSANDWTFPETTTPGSNDKLLLERSSDGAKQYTQLRYIVPGAITEVAAGTGILVTDPTGPFVTVAANIGTGAGQVAAGDNVLTRGSNDWVGYATQAGSLDPNDKLLIERVSDGAKRVVLASSLPTGGGATEVPGADTNHYAVRPTTPDPFDDEFDSGSSDLAVRGWTVINWTTGAAMTRAGDINPWVAGNASVPTGQYRSTLVGGQMLIQSVDILYAYKVSTGSATYVVASDVTRADSTANTHASVAVVNAANRTGLIIGYTNNLTHAMNKITDPSTIGGTVYIACEGETAVVVAQWDDTAKTGTAIIAARQSGRILTSGTTTGYSTLTSGRAGLRVVTNTAGIGNWAIFDYVRKLPGTGKYPGIP